MINAMTLIFGIVNFPFLEGDVPNYKLEKILGRTDFSEQFRIIIIIICHKRFCYNLNGMRQYACLLISPITVDNFAALFNCTPLDRASDSMMVPT